MLGRGLSCGGLGAANSGDVKVDWEPRPSFKHLNNADYTHNCRMGGIVGMCYFSQM